MKQIILFLCGMFLLLGASVMLAEPAQSKTPQMELTHVEYDYHFHEGYLYEPTNQYFEPEIIGQLTMTFKVKHLRSFRAEYSEGHYLTPDEAPIYSSIPMLCTLEDETVNVSLPLTIWGSWARCVYVDSETGEYIYTPKVWSTDYIDAETLALVLGDIDTINENNDDVLISLNVKDLSISNTQGNPVHLAVYTTQGQQIFNYSLQEDSTISLGHIERGIYILKVVTTTKNLSKKISLR